MNPADAIIRDVSAAGGVITVQDGRLKLSAPQALPPVLLDRIRAAKPELLASLTTSSWRAADWQAYYDERAAIHEYEGKLPRAEAERKALDTCIAHWLNQHPPTHRSPDTCPQCNSAISLAANNALPFITGNGGHIWLHDRCHAGWLERRKEEAARALAVLLKVVKSGS